MSASNGSSSGDSSERFLRSSLLRNSSSGPCLGERRLGVHMELDVPFTEEEVGEAVLSSVTGEPGSSSDGVLHRENRLLWDEKDSSVVSISMSLLSSWAE